MIKYEINTEITKHVSQKYDIVEILNEPSEMKYD